MQKLKNSTRYPISPVTKQEYIARTVLYGLSTMNARDFKRVINWLKLTADMLEKEGKEDRKIFSKRFIARLMNS